MDNLFGKDEDEEREQTTKPKAKKTAKKAKSDTPQPESFEAAMSELEELVRSLESGQLPLDETVTTYKRARDLAKWCYEKLTDVQGELKKLGLDEEGNFVLDDLPPLE